MQFFFSILVTCAVFVNGYHKKQLIPLVSEKNSIIENKGFLDLAKNNPKELIEEMKKADPEKVNEVIVLLEAMVTSSEAQISQLVADLEGAKEDLLAKHRGYSNKKQIWDDAAEAKALAQGKVSEAEADAAAQLPALEQEINSLTDILNLLDSLVLDTVGRRRTLLGYEEKELHTLLGAIEGVDPAKVNEIRTLVDRLIASSKSQLDVLKRRTLLSIDQEKVLLGAMETADPAKVNEIRDLVDGLIASSRSQLDVLNGMLSDARAELATLTSAAAVAAGELADAQTAKDVAQGILDEAQRRQDENMLKLQAEVKTLNDVITLLKTIN